MTEYYTILDSPIGTLLSTSDGRTLTRVHMNAGRSELRPGRDWERADNDAVLQEAAEQIRAYFDGRRTAFDLPLAPAGTEFQKLVWAELVKIPHGETASYAEIAARIGQPSACRAVGMANARNPIAIVIPCHRVIGASGNLVGYGGGLANKQRLLDLERRTSPDRSDQRLPLS